MIKIESYVNESTESVRPLDLTPAIAPASCFWAAFNGAAVGFLTAKIAEKAVDYIHKQQAGGAPGAYIADAAMETALRSASLSGDALVNLRTAAGR